MLRITTRTLADRLMVRLEGRLLAINLHELERVVGERRPGSGALQLELDQLRYLDAEALAVLCRLLHEGAQVTTSTPFVGHLLQGCAP